jgi:hypothetical protein
MWTTVEDIEARWVPSDENRASRETIDAWIADAETIVLHRFPDVSVRIASGDLPIERVRLVVCSMVLRVLRNPSNHRQQASGPFSVTFAGESPGGIWITDEEAALLSASAARTPGSAFTIDPTPHDSPYHDSNVSTLDVS